MDRLVSVRFKLYESANVWPRSMRQVIKHGQLGELFAIPETDEGPKYELTREEKIEVIMKNRRRGWYYDQRTGKWYKKEEVK